MNEYNNKQWSNGDNKPAAECVDGNPSTDDNDDEYLQVMKYMTLDIKFIVQLNKCL